MSIKHLRACWPIQTTPAKKAVLIALADLADGAGRWSPRLREVCRMTCLCERAVRDAIRSLAGAGLVSIEHRPGRPAVITVTPPALEHVDTPAGNAGVLPGDLPTTPAGNAGVLVPGTPAPDADTPAGNAGTPAPDAGHISPHFSPLPVFKGATIGGPVDNSKTGNGAHHTAARGAIDTLGTPRHVQPPRTRRQGRQGEREDDRKGARYTPGPDRTPRLSEPTPAARAAGEGVIAELKKRTARGRA